MNPPKDVIESPYLAARKAFVTLTHPDAGTHGYMTLPFRLSLTPGGQHRASPCLGADTRKVLVELAGLTAQEFDELEAEGVTCNIPSRVAIIARNQHHDRLSAHQIRDATF